MARTVIRLGVEGLNSNKWQNGTLWAAPNIQKQLPYTLIGGIPASMTAAVAALDTMLHTECAKGPVDVYGHSVRAQLICKWLRDYGPTSTLSTNPTNLRFLMAANPEHKYTGQMKASSGYNLYGGNGFPDSTPYTVYSMTRQYDIYGDYPTDHGNAAAMANVGSVPFGPGFAIHLDYQNTPYFDPGGTDSGYVTWTDPSHTTLHYIWSRTYPVAQLQSLKSLQYWVRSQDKSVRATIESGYSRPAVVPAPLYNI